MYIDTVIQCKADIYINRVQLEEIYVFKYLGALPVKYSSYTKPIHIRNATAMVMAGLDRLRRSNTIGSAVKYRQVPRSSEPDVGTSDVDSV